MIESETIDCLMVVSFGGPEGPDDVLPFLENVLRGRNVPASRMAEVVEHYQHFGGFSPINRQNRELIETLESEFRKRKIRLPVYFGNRNWHPFLTETLRTMHEDGRQRALALFTSAFSSYSGCRQYHENIAAARSELNGAAPQVEKLRMFFNHPGFIDAAADRVRVELDAIDPDRRQTTRIVFTAHSIPESMAENCHYVEQLTESCRLVADRLGTRQWNLAYQSRSGPPSQPWLEPDICDFLKTLDPKQIRDVVIMPIGFLSDHMEVLFDLDTEARDVCNEPGIRMRRAGSVGVHPRFVSMIADLVEERLNGSPRIAIGNLPASHHVCPADCCLSGALSRRPVPNADRPE